MKLACCVRPVALLVAAAGVFAAGYAIAQDGKQPEGAKPAGQPGHMEQMDDKAMMEAWAQANALNEHHAKMQKAVGRWTAKTSTWMAPGTEPMVSDATATFKPMFGGRFLSEDFEGEFAGQKFQGHSMMGYNNATGKYETVWCDSMSTGIMFLTGTPSPDGKSVTYTGEGVDPMTKENKKFKSVTTDIDANTMKFEMYEQMDGMEFKSLEIVYTRGGSPDTMNKLRDKMREVKPDGATAPAAPAAPKAPAAPAAPQAPAQGK